MPYKYNPLTDNFDYYNDASGSGDMLKDVYDIDKNGIVNKAESVDDGTGNSKTASEIKEHIESTSDPHHTKSDIDIADAITKKHTQNTDQYLDFGGINQISAETLKKLSLLQNSDKTFIEQIKVELQKEATVIHTDSDPDSLNSVIQTLDDGDILEVDSTVTYNPISIPSNKSLIIRPKLGKCIKLTGTECIKLMNGSRDTIISGVAINNSVSPAINERGAAISFGEHETIVSNITFYNISIDTVTLGSGVMLSYHWSLNGDTYYTPNTLEECSDRVSFIDCCFYKANKDNTEGASLSLRGINNVLIYNCHFRDNALSMRQIQLQNCQLANISNNHIRNTATPGTNSEGIKIDELGSCTYRSSATIVNNIIRNAVEGIDIDDNVDAFCLDNVCYECTEEGISVDDSAIAVLARNLCYCCHYDENSAGFTIENGALVNMYQNNAVNNSIDYNILNGYSLPSGNSTLIEDIILKDTADNVIYDGDIPDAHNLDEALNILFGEISNCIISEANGDWKRVTNLQYNPTTGEIKVLYEE